MNLQVLPLKVLATREVVMKRLDYSTYLTGITKEELDRLDKLKGIYKIQSSKLTIEAHYNGKRLPSDDWEYFKECMQGIQMPANVVKFIEGSSKFTIEETRGVLRTWVVRDKLYSDREFLRGRGHVSSEMGQWTYWDEFIEDGKLVGVVKGFVMNNGKMELAFDCRDSITTDKEGIIVREFMWSQPGHDIKITKVMWARRMKREEMLDSLLDKLKIYIQEQGGDISGLDKCQASEL